MTREEAIKTMKDTREVVSDHGRKAFDMAIKALKQEPCEDCISRQAVLDTEYQIKEINGIEYVMLSEVQMKAMKLPSVNPKEPKTGRWILTDSDLVYCSECGRTLIRRENYCPNCGAKMESKGLEMTDKDYADILKDLVVPVHAEAAMDRAIDVLEQEPETGHWIMHDRHRECSKCNVWFPKDMPRNSFCPNCGAKMESEE